MKINGVKIPSLHELYMSSDLRNEFEDEFNQYAIQKNIEINEENEKMLIEIHKNTYSDIYDKLVDSLKSTIIYRVIGVLDDSLLDITNVGVHWTDKPEYLYTEDLEIDGDHLWFMAKDFIQCVDFNTTFKKRVSFPDESEIHLFPDCEITLKKICDHNSYEHDDGCQIINEKVYT